MNVVSDPTSFVASIDADFIFPMTYELDAPASYQYATGERVNQLISTGLWREHAFSVPQDADGVFEVTSFIA